MTRQFANQTDSTHPPDHSAENKTRSAQSESNSAKLQHRIATKTAVAGVIGQGYVGLPLALEISNVGYDCIGFDVDPAVVTALNTGQSAITTVSGQSVSAATASGRYAATCDLGRIAACDVVVICVPTPVEDNKTPMMQHIFDCCHAIADHATPGTLVILESTSFPFTTAEVVAPLVSSGSLQLGDSIFVGFSPEREDPGSAQYSVRSIPRLTSGVCDTARTLTTLFYQQIVDTVHPVSNPKIAEAAKLTENIFRSVNIALVNELKAAFARMDIDIWEVIDAAGTKPFGYMPFQPGPGVGGHCIPVDPYYLIWKAKEFGCDLRLVETAAKKNDLLPEQVAVIVKKTLSREYGINLNGRQIVVIGVAYKPNLDDVRESPGLKIMQHLQNHAARVGFIDHHVGTIPQHCDHPGLAGLCTLRIGDMAQDPPAAFIIATDHNEFDYAALLACDVPIFDTRNVMHRRGLQHDRVIRI